jgi:TonB family protein
MRNVLKLVPLVFVLLPAAAAGQTLRLTGVISDPSGAVLPGVAVRVESTAGARPMTAVTDVQGRYQIDALSPGAYTVAARLAGFENTEVSVSLSVVDVERNITMRLGELMETITIRAGEPPPPPVRYPVPATPQVPPPAPAGVVRVGGNIKPPTKTANVAPVYPATLAAQKVGGVVILAVEIGPDGLVHNITTVRSPHTELTRAATDAIALWEFTPTLLNGVPVPVRMVAHFNFEVN